MGVSKKVSSVADQLTSVSAPAGKSSPPFGDSSSISGFLLSTMVILET